MFPSFLTDLNTSVGGTGGGGGSGTGGSTGAGASNANMNASRQQIASPHPSTLPSSTNPLNSNINTGSAHGISGLSSQPTNGVGAGGGAASGSGAGTGVSGMGGPPSSLPPSHLASPIAMFGSGGAGGSVMGGGSGGSGGAMGSSMAGGPSPGGSVGSGMSNLGGLGGLGGGMGLGASAAGANTGLNILPTPVGHQMDLNYLWQQVQELSTLLAQNREATQGIVRRVGELQRRAAERALKEAEESNHTGRNAVGEVRSV